MLTLREFLLDIANDSTHFRIYMPNRDCLAYESYVYPHTPPGTVDDFSSDLKFHNSLTSHLYVQTPSRMMVKYGTEKFDRETQKFIDRYGDCKVIGVEISRCRPLNYYIDRSNPDDIKVTSDYSILEKKQELDCYNIFVSFEQEKDYEQEKQAI